MQRYTVRQGEKNILQQVKLTVLASDKEGFLKINHGDHNNGICQVRESCHAPPVRRSDRETPAGLCWPGRGVRPPSSEPSVTPTAVWRGAAG